MEKADKRLMLRCLATVAAVRLGLTFSSHRTVRRWLPQKPLARAQASQLQRISWGVQAAAKLVPDASCLTQALAGQWLLAADGVRSDVRVGVTRDDKGAFKAHAWLVSDGRIVLGATHEDLSQFTPLTDLSPRLP